MSFEINTVPPSASFPQPLTPGTSIAVPPGAVLELIDTDTGEVVDPTTLGVEVQPDGSLLITLPDGTQVTLAGASPEQVEPAAGPENIEPEAGPAPAGPGPDAGGSSEAVATYLFAFAGNIFDLAGRTQFAPPGTAPLDIPDPEPLLAEGGPPPTVEALLSLEEGESVMVLEDKGLVLDLSDIGGPVTLSGLPPGARVVDALGTEHLVDDSGTVGVPAGLVTIFPPLHDDTNFSFDISGEGTLIQDVQVQVKAVADLAKIVLDGVDIGEPGPLSGNPGLEPSQLTKNQIQWEMEPYLCKGTNDTIGTAQEIGSIDGTNGAALTVNGWLATAEFSDVDVFKFTVDQRAKLVIDIDFGEVDHGKHGPDSNPDNMGRVDSADAAIFVFDMDGNLVHWDKDGGPGDDPLIDGHKGNDGFSYNAGMYFVAVTQDDNVNWSEVHKGARFEDLFKDHNTNRYADGDYQLQVRTGHDDITPGNMVTYMVTEDNPMLTADGDFEFGLFSGWMALGDTDIVGDGLYEDSGPSSGDYQALLTTRGHALPGGDGDTPPSLEALLVDSGDGDRIGDAVPIWKLAHFMGVRVQDLKGLDIGGVDHEDQDPFEGSAIKGKFWVKEGQKLTFDWNFLTDEDSGARDAFGDEGNDMAVIAITDDDGNVVFLGTLAEFLQNIEQGDTTEPGSFDFDQETGYTGNSSALTQPFMYEFLQTGVYNVSIAVFDQGDNFFDSGLLIDNVAVDGVTPGSIHMLGVSGRGDDNDPGSVYKVDDDSGYSKLLTDPTEPNTGDGKVGLTGVAVDQSSGEAYASSIGGEKGARFSQLLQIDPKTGEALGDGTFITKAVGGTVKVIDFGGDDADIFYPSDHSEDGFRVYAPESGQDVDLRDPGDVGDSHLVMHPDSGNPSTIFVLENEAGKPFTLQSFDIEFENIEPDEGLAIRGYDAEGNEIASYFVPGDVDEPITISLPDSFRNVSRVEFEQIGVDAAAGFENDQVVIDNITVLDSTVPISDLSFEPGTGTLYGTGSGTNLAADGGMLYTIDPATGVATLVADLSETLDVDGQDLSITASSIAFDPDTGVLYAVVFDTDGDQAYIATLDSRGMLVDGADSLHAINGTDLPEFFLLDGLGVRPSDGVIFGTSSGSGNNTGSSDGSIWTIDATTGLVTFVGETEIGVSDMETGDFAKLSDVDFYVKPQSSLDTTNKHSIDDLDLMVRDPDGSESVTYVKIDVNDLSGGDDLPPGFKIGFGDVLHKGGGYKSGDFLQDGDNWVRIEVQRIDSNDPDVGPEGMITEEIKFKVHYDEGEGLIYFDVPDHLRVQNVNLDGLMWTTEKSNDQDFNIEVMVRTTETHHEFSVHPNHEFGYESDDQPIFFGKTTVHQIDVEVPEGEVLLDIDVLTKIVGHYGPESDLTITLTAPDGVTSVTLSSNNDFKNGKITWDDQDNDPVTQDHNDHSTLTVESALGAFMGIDPNGTWTIEITDNSPKAAVITFGGIDNADIGSGDSPYTEDGFKLYAVEILPNPPEDDIDIQDPFGGDDDAHLVMHPNDFQPSTTFAIESEYGKPFMLMSFDLEGSMLEPGDPEDGGQEEGLMVTAYAEDGTTVLGSFTVEDLSDGTVEVPEDFPQIVYKVEFSLFGQLAGNASNDYLNIDNIRLLKSEGELDFSKLKLTTIPEDQLSLKEYSVSSEQDLGLEIEHEGSKDGYDYRATESKIWVDGVKGDIKDVDLLTDITHPDSGSLTIQLISPEGTKVLIVKGVSDNMNDWPDLFEDVTWDDQANNPVTDTMIFVDGHYEPELTPESAMAAFMGEDPNGYWKLKVYDVEKELHTIRFGNQELDLIDPQTYMEDGFEIRSLHADGVTTPPAPPPDLDLVDPIDGVADDIALRINNDPTNPSLRFELAAKTGAPFDLQSFRIEFESLGDDGDDIPENDDYLEIRGYDEAGDVVATHVIPHDVDEPLTIDLPDSFQGIYRVEFEMFNAEDVEEVLIDDIKVAKTAGTLNDWGLDFTVFDGTELAVPHAYNTTTIMVNNKAVADKPMFGELTVVDFDQSTGYLYKDGCESYTEEGVKLDVVKGGGVLLGDFSFVYDNDAEGEESELSLTSYDKILITAENGGNIGLLSLDIEKESLEGYDNVRIYGVDENGHPVVDSMGIPIAYLELGHETFGYGDFDGTILLPSGFADVAGVVIQAKFSSNDPEHDHLIIDNVKVKLPLEAAVHHEDNATHIDGAFADGTAGWNLLGDAERDSGFLGYNGADDGHYLVLTTSHNGGAVSASELEAFMGVEPGTLEGLESGSEEGSVAQVTLKLTAGDKVTFDWAFATKEATDTSGGNVDNDDYGFVIVTPGGPEEIIQSTEGPYDFTYFPGGGYSGTGGAAYLFVAQTTGTYTFNIGVVDESNNGSASGKSALLIDQFSVNGWPVNDSALTDVSPFYGLDTGVTVTDTDGSESLTAFGIKYDPDTFAANGAQLGHDGQAGLDVGDEITLHGVMRLDEYGNPSTEPVVATVSRLYTDPHSGMEVVEFSLDPADRVQQIDLTDEIGIVLPMHKDAAFDVWVFATATETNVSDTVELINGETVDLDFAAFTQENGAKIRLDGPGLDGAPDEGGQPADAWPTVSYITVQGVEGSIQSVDFLSKLFHDAPGDLVVTLTSPSDTSVTISSSDYSSYQETFVTAFDGEDPNGQWKLVIEDLSKGDADGHAKVAVFDNGSFVDTAPTNDGTGTHESAEIQESLAYLEHDVSTFTGTSADDINDALHGKDVLVIPEQEVASLVDPAVDGSFDADALQAIRDFVEQGGKVIVNGTPGVITEGSLGNAAALLNALLGLTGGDALGEVQTFEDGDEAGLAGTLFEGGPHDVGPDGPETANNYTGALTNVQEGGGVHSVYEDSAGNTVVGQFDLGAGNIVYLGWDWFFAEPPQVGQDADWLKVLDLAASMGDDTTGYLKAWQLLITTETTKQQIAVESQTMEDTLHFEVGAVADQAKFSDVTQISMGTEDLVTNDTSQGQKGVDQKYVVDELMGGNANGYDHQAQFADRSEFGHAENAADEDVVGPNLQGVWSSKHFSGSIDSADDSDVYAFQSYAGERVRIDIDLGKDQGGGENPADIRIELVGPDGTVLAVDDDPAGFGDPEIPTDSSTPLALFDLPDDGVYYVVVRGGDGNGGDSVGDYELFISLEDDSLQAPVGSEITWSTDFDELFSPGDPGAPVPIELTVETPDTDGSERLMALKLTGLQEGATVWYKDYTGTLVSLTDGVDDDAADGKVTVDVTQYQGTDYVFANGLLDGNGLLTSLDTGDIMLSVEPAEHDGDNMWVGVEVATEEVNPMGGPDNVHEPVTWTSYMGDQVLLEFNTGTDEAGLTEYHEGGFVIRNQFEGSGDHHFDVLDTPVNLPGSSHDATGANNHDGDGDEELVLHNSGAVFAALSHEADKPFDLISFEVEFENHESGEKLVLRGFDDGGQVAQYEIDLGDYDLDYSDASQHFTVAVPSEFRQVTHVTFALEGANGDFGNDRVHLDNLMLKSPATIEVEVKEIADKPTLDVQDLCIVEDGDDSAATPAPETEPTKVTLDVGASLVDQDGSEGLYVTIEGLPEGVTLADVGDAPGNAFWTLQDGTLTGNYWASDTLGIGDGVSIPNPVICLPPNFNTAGLGGEMITVDFGDFDGDVQSYTDSEHGVVFTALGPDPKDLDIENQGGDSALRMHPDSGEQSLSFELKCVDGGEFDLATFDIESETLEGSEGEALIITGFAADGSTVLGMETISFAGGIATTTIDLSSPDTGSFAGVSSVVFEVVGNTGALQGGYSDDFAFLDNFVLNKPTNSLELTVTAQTQELAAPAGIGDGATAQEWSIPVTDTIELKVVPVNDTPTIGFVSDTINAEWDAFDSGTLDLGFEGSGDNPLLQEIEVSGFHGLITDVDVLADFTGWTSELEITITSPDGTTVELANDSLSGGGGTTKTLVFSDGGAGENDPVGRLADLLGEDPNGTWTISIGDTDGVFQIDAGTLHNWGLDIHTAGGLVLESTGPKQDMFEATPNAAVPPSGTSGLTEVTLDVSGLDGELLDLNVFLDLTHTYSGDLEVTLTAPNGTSVLLTDNLGGAADVVPVVIDDESFGPSVASVGLSAPFVLPFEPLSAFDGLSGDNPDELNGTWTLTLNDTLGGDVGFLESWRLDFTTTGDGGPGMLMTEANYADASPDNMIDLSWLQVYDEEAWDDGTPIEVTLQVSYGTLDFGSTTGLMFSNAAGDELTTFTGTVADIDTALGTLKYTPDEGFVGDDQLSVDVDDLGNSAAPADNDNDATYAITVKEPAFQPRNDTVITNSGVTNIGDSISILSAALLANDFGTGLEVVSVSNWTGPGAISLSGDGGHVTLDAPDTPGETATFDYTAMDGAGFMKSATVTVFFDDAGQLPLGDPIDGMSSGDDIGNGGNEIYVAVEDPHSVIVDNPIFPTFEGGDGDDIFQVQDEDRFDIDGGPGTDIILPDPDSVDGSVYSFDLPSTFNASNGIQVIDGTLAHDFPDIDEVILGGTISGDNWDFTGIELIGIDAIATDGGDDRVVGSAGDDVIIGGRGEDMMDGAMGNDTFLWLQGDDGDGGYSNYPFLGDFGLNITTDEISGFESTMLFGSASNDVIDISDLFEDIVTAGQEVVDGFMDVTFGGGNTTLHIDVDGSGTSEGFPGPNNDAFEQQIVLVGVDLSSVGGGDPQAVIDALTDADNLITA